VISLCQLLWFNSLFLVAIKVQPNLLLDEWGQKEETHWYFCCQTIPMHSLKSLGVLCAQLAPCTTQHFFCRQHTKENL
jgi:hypothetical protein